MKTSSIRATERVAAEHAAAVRSVAGQARDRASAAAEQARIAARCGWAYASTLVRAMFAK